MALSFSGRFKVMTLTFSSASYRPTGSAIIRSPPLNRMAREPVDCRETLANAADHRNARRAKIRNLLLVHDARPGVQQVMGLAAILSRAHKQLEVAPGELRHLEGLTIAIVAAEDDYVVVGAAVEQTEGVRQVRNKGAVTPGVERVAVAADKADPALDFFLCRGRQRRQPKTSRPGNVEDQLRQSTGRSDDADPAPRRATRALGSREHLGKLDEVRHFDCAMRAQQLRDKARLAGEPARVSRHGMSHALGSPDLQHHHRFPLRRGTIECGDKAI